MGALFESLVKKDDRFESPAERHLGLVIFRLKVKKKQFSFFLFFHSFLFCSRVKMN
jgi:hypothetical protein